ncbi:MAG TPA: PD-(D/E)XK nuclease-like domain-containing protein [Pelomicrobium sp.]|nr:PD-(D/E)XK nuclease-like domain-containing protein [Pelomicrobium sp.]
MSVASIHPASPQEPDTPGRVLTVREPLAAYLARTDHASSSMLRRFAAGLATRNEIFPGSLMGDALHAYLLEPEAFDEQYLALDGSVPAGRRLTEPEAMRRTWLSPEQVAALARARAAVEGWPHAPVGRWLREGRKELSLYWRDERGGAWKARPDCFTDEVIVELKTTFDCRPEVFAATRARLGYDLQAAHYVEAVTLLTGRRPRFVFVAVEMGKPGALWVHELAEAALAAATEELERLKERYSAAAGASA